MPNLVNPTEMNILTKSLARQIGFELCGICRPAPIEHVDYLRNWLANGRAGSMAYMHRHVESRENIASWLPWARSVIVVGLNYRQPPPAVATDDDRQRGKIAMYAWGEDYHTVLREKLQRVVEEIERAIGRDFESRICVDTAAVVERELAASSGVGWIGKNTMVLHPRLGSFFFLGVLATELDIEPDAPTTDHCGSCTRCLDACPTGAFPAPYEMDASRCISYLTIEHRGDIDPALESKLGEWVFGCDDCQTVCPFNHWEAKSNEGRFTAPNADAAYPVLDEIDSAAPTDLRRQHKARATSRARPDMWKRNAVAVRKLIDKKNNV